MGGCSHGETRCLADCICEALRASFSCCWETLPASCGDTVGKARLLQGLGMGRGVVGDEWKRRADMLGAIRRDWLNGVFCVLV
jgi:hypothetical protein